LGMLGMLGYYLVPGNTIREAGQLSKFSLLKPR
jgi:hypothetical protein